MENEVVVVLGRDGRARAVYHDAIPTEAMGRPTITRASNVEAIPGSDPVMWKAESPTGVVLAEGRYRDRVIQEERSYLERLL